MSAHSPPPSCCDGLAPSAPQTSFDLAMQVLHQPMPPTVREILQAYSKSGKDDRDLLLALLKAKTAEDDRIAAQTTLHRSLLHLQYGLPLPPSPQPSHSDAAPPPPTSERLPYPNSHSHSAHPSYPSPSTSSPPNSHSPSRTLPPINLPPLATALGKHARSPPTPVQSHHGHTGVTSSPPLARQPGTTTSPPSRASPMSLRGILHEGQGGSVVTSDEHRAAKRRNLAARPTAQELYQHSPDSSRSHRVSDERTTSRDERE